MTSVFVALLSALGGAVVTALPVLLVSERRRLLRVIAEEAKLLESVADEEVKGEVRAAMLSSLSQYKVLAAQARSERIRRQMVAASVPLSPILSVGVVTLVASILDRFSSQSEVVQSAIALGSALAVVFPLTTVYLMSLRLRSAVRDERESRRARDDI